MRNLFVLVASFVSRETARRTCAIVFALLAIPGSANAGVIVAGGDITPIFSLTDTAPNPATPGNRQFFSNVLGSGTRVLVQGTIGNAFAGTELNEFYNSLPGVTSTLLAAGDPVTAADLVNKDLFLSALPDPFSPSEIAAIGGFVATGGSLFVMGDGTILASADPVNELLAGIGSSLSLGAVDFDDGPQTATGPEIVAHALTSGVASLNYGATLLVGGGSPLFLTNGLQPFIAVEGVAAAVPEPASLLLVFAAFASICFATRRMSLRSRAL